MLVHSPLILTGTTFDLKKNLLVNVKINVNHYQMRGKYCIACCCFFFFY